MHLRPRLAARLAAALLVPLLLSGCSEGSGGKEGTVPDTDAHGRYVIHLTADNRFDPEVARVPSGSQVVWVVDAGAAHDVDGYAPGAEHSSFHSPGGSQDPMTEGEEFAATLTEKGKWTVYCHTHHYEEMRGYVVVH